MRTIVQVCRPSRVTRPGWGVGGRRERGLGAVVGALGFGSAELRWDVGVCGRVWAPLGLVAEKCRT